MILTLKELRLSKKLSMQKLANELEVGVASIGRWERGEYKPMRFYREKLALYFNVTIDELEF